MWKFWKSSLALSLGLMASSACGQEGGWQTTPTRPGESNRESIAPVQPIGLAAPSTTSNRSPAATLQRPIPVYDSQEGAAGPDPSVQPTAFRGVFGLLNDTPASDAPLAKPLPAATIAPGTLSARSWRRADDQQNPEKINPPKESADSTSG